MKTHKRLDDVVTVKRTNYLAEIEKRCAVLEQQQLIQTSILQIILGQASYETALFQIIKAVSQHIGWDWGELWSIDSGKNSLVHVVHWHSISAPTNFEDISKQITFTPGTGLPGRVWASMQPLWIANISEDSNFLRASFAQKDGLHTGFGIPVQADGRVLGVMSFFSRNMQETDRHLLEMLLAIGQQLGMFIERKRSEAIAKPDVTLTNDEQDRLAHHLRTITDQTLFPASILSELLPYMWDGDFNRLWDSVGELQRFTRQALYQTHRLLADLGMEHAAEISAAGLLDQLISKFTSLYQLNITLTAKGDCPLTVNAQIAMYCIVQEALQNVIQHARATKVTVSLFAYSDAGVLRIVDNGRGFNPTLVLQDRLGFRIMRECAEKVGASLNITSKVNDGTQIELQWSNSQQ